jgi:hypothetical protein
VYARNGHLCRCDRSPLHTERWHGSTETLSIRHTVHWGASAGTVACALRNGLLRRRASRLGSQSSRLCGGSSHLCSRSNHLCSRLSHLSATAGERVGTADTSFPSVMVDSLVGQESLVAFAKFPDQTTQSAICLCSHEGDDSAARWDSEKAGWPVGIQYVEAWRVGWADPRHRTDAGDHSGSPTVYLATGRWQVPGAANSPSSLRGEANNLPAQ